MFLIDKLSSKDKSKFYCAGKSTNLFQLYIITKFFICDSSIIAGLLGMWYIREEYDNPKPRSPHQATKHSESRDATAR